MNEKPLENGSQRASRKPALDDAAVDPDGDLEFPVFRVEMRGKVIAEVHPNHDSEEARQLRHGGMVTRRGGELNTHLAA